MPGGLRASFPPLAGDPICRAAGSGAADRDTAGGGGLQTRGVPGGPAHAPRVPRPALRPRFPGSPAVGGRRPGQAPPPRSPASLAGRPAPVRDPDPVPARPGLPPVSAAVHLPAADARRCTGGHASLRHCRPTRHVDLPCPSARHNPAPASAGDRRRRRSPGTHRRRQRSPGRTVAGQEDPDCRSRSSVSSCHRSAAGRPASGTPCPRHAPPAAHPVRGPTRCSRPVRLPATLRPYPCLLASRPLP